MNLGDAHIYEEHKTQVIRQILRTPLDFPEIKIKTPNDKKIESYEFENIEIINYDSKIIEKNFDNNLKDFKNVYKVKDNSDNFFLQNNNKFEVIYIDGSHLSSQVYKDCLNAWSALQTNGFLICDDYIWSHYKKIEDNPCFAINAFLRKIKNQYNLFIVSNNQIFIRKI
jgi:hypothetical protein